ncbi:MAG: flagellar hook-basal body complex protein FliE [Tepidiforma sp.]|nr:MAG: flagellar hook-basal body complex protein FliE [Tepidiforma sp.]
MDIAPIQSQLPLRQTGAATAPPAAGFADLLGRALNQLQSLSDTADQKVNALATGQDVELHDVMLAVEAESLAISLATQVRNKAVEAYQEIFRMQI